MEKKQVSFKQCSLLLFYFFAHGHDAYSSAGAADQISGCSACRCDGHPGANTAAQSTCAQVVAWGDSRLETALDVPV